MKRCKGCEGAGLLPQGFKANLPGSGLPEAGIPRTTDGEPILGEVCQTCNGSGKVK